jgi:hypothetical protein
MANLFALMITVLRHIILHAPWRILYISFMETANKFFGMDHYMARFSPYIKRHEARVLAQGYVVGLMMDEERKSVEPLSEKVHASERGMQRLLTAAKWDHVGEFCECRKQMRNETDDPQGVLMNVFSKPAGTKG